MSTPILEQDHTTRKTAPAPAASKTVQLGAQISLPYVEQGEPSGIPLIFLHGYTDSWRSFEPVLPHLPAHLHAYAVTLRGHGDATRPTSGYSPAEFAADVAAFMDALEIESAVIVGHSMGSYIAQCFALNYPERTRGLVLIGSFTKLAGKACVTELWEGVSAFTDVVDPDFALEFQQSTLARRIPQGFLDMVVEESLKLPPKVWKAVLKDLLASDFSEQIKAINSPTLILWGEQDALFLKGEQETLRSAIADSQLLIYPNTGHALHWEEPQRFADDLVNFVATLTR
jgi:pimeloyl-ACP methyl ester carboxylesterase